MKHETNTKYFYATLENLFNHYKSISIDILYHE